MLVWVFSLCFDISVLSGLYFGVGMCLFTGGWFDACGLIWVLCFGFVFCVLFGFAVGWLLALILCDLVFGTCCRWLWYLFDLIWFVI